MSTRIPSSLPPGLSPPVSTGPADPAHPAAAPSTGAAPPTPADLFAARASQPAAFAGGAGGGGVFVPGGLNLNGRVSGPDVIHTLSSRRAFDRMSSAGTGAGAAGMPEVKFLLDRQDGQLYFLPKKYPYHYLFAKDVLKVPLSLEAFNKEAYLDPDRRFVAGTMTGFDNFVDGNNQKGAYGLSFWSTDIVRSPLLLETYKAIEAGLPFAKGKLFYHPGGETQEQLLDKDGGADRKALQAAGIPIHTNTDLSASFDFSALNPGVSYGQLRVIHGTGAGEATPTRREVVIYADEIPAELPPVAGVATPKPQTYLSHVALKARQDDTPYAYARDILKDPKVQGLEGKIVRFEVTPSGYAVSEATQAEADAFLEKLRPTQPQVLKPDLSVKDARSLDRIGFRDARAFGTKATNVAELHKLERSGALDVSGPGEPEVIAPDGFGIPGAWYDEFFKNAKYDASTTFDQRLTQMLADPDFQNDPAERTRQLADLQEHIKDAPLPPSLQRKVDDLQRQFAAKFPGQDMRIRSSSDSEDLQGFNGAGLFDSYTFRFADANRPGRSLADRLKRVFASVWNERAFSEFDFYRIAPHSVNMSELAMPNTDDEIANGVVRWGGAIPGWDTMTVNAQVGESLVTNPDGGATPDALVVGNYGFNNEPEIQYEQKTNQPLPPGRTHVLTDGEVKALFKAMKVVQEHFKGLYGGDENFNIESEFKITSDGKLLIKQARPWVG